MRNLIQIGMVLAAVVLAGGIGVVFVVKTRAAAARMSCSNNLKQIGIGLHTYHDIFGHLPTGTISNPALAPEKRLSWAVEIFPTFMEGGIRVVPDKEKAWDAPANYPPQFRFRADPDEPGAKREGVVPEVRSFLCPALPARIDGSLPAPLHYVGVAGVGPDAAELSLPHRRAGAFGHDRKVGFADFADGQAVTMLLVEAEDAGPWTAGGHATVRPFPDNRPGLCPFTCPHKGRAANVLMGNGHVRVVTASTSPEVFAALATIAGAEDIDLPAN